MESNEYYYNALKLKMKNEEAHKNSSKLISASLILSNDLYFSDKTTFYLENLKGFFLENDEENIIYSKKKTER